MKRMSPQEFRDEGWLFEVNRQFFHPFGLALSVKVNRDTGEVEGIDAIFDCRDDDEGFEMGEGHVAEHRERSQRIVAEQQRRFAIRRARLGFDVEPLDRG